MKRFKFVLALVFVIILIAGALWTRFGHTTQANSDLVTVNAGTTSDTAATEAAAQLADLTATLPSSSSTPENLTSTDLIARQLVSNFLDLTANGQVTDDNIARLADTYTQNIAELDTGTQLTIADITVNGDSHDHFQSYADIFSKIYSKYQGLILSAYNDTHGADLTTDRAALTSFAQVLGGIYSREAQELKALPAPASLAQDHLKLVNNYSSDANAYQSLTNANKDPANAFAGIVLVKRNYDDEQTILSNIQTILTSNGI